MALKSILDHFKSFKTNFFKTIFRGGQAKQLWNMDNFFETSLQNIKLTI